MRRCVEGQALVEARDRVAILLVSLVPSTSTSSLLNCSTPWAWEGVGGLDRGRAKDEPARADLQEQA